MTYHKKRRERLYIGSDVEIANRVIADLEDELGEIIYAEGAVWRYRTSRWAPISETELRVAVHKYDGAIFQTASGEPSHVKLSKSRVDSTLNEMFALLADPDFFKNPTTGINCASGFIRFDVKGTPHLLPYNRDHHCRHTLPGRWNPETPFEVPPSSLLGHLLSGVFKGDSDADADGFGLEADQGDGGPGSEAV